MERPEGYTCSACGGAVARQDTVCPRCAASLRGIGCRSCGLAGPEGLFAGDRCPRCGATVARPGAPPPPPAAGGRLPAFLLWAAAALLAIGVGTCAGRCGASPYGAHAPDTQAFPGGHSTAQSPQLVGSRVTSLHATQSPVLPGGRGQSLVGAGQAHAPETQEPAPHDSRHSPQLPAAVRSLQATQDVPPIHPRVSPGAGGQ